MVTQFMRSIAGLLCVFALSAYGAEAPVVLSPEQLSGAHIKTQMLAADSTGAGRLTLTGRVETAEHGPDPILSPAAGRVVGVYAHSGDSVQPGQPILALSGPEIAVLRRGYQDAVTLAGAAMRHAQREGQLYEEGITSQARSEQAQAAMTVADRQLASQRQVLGGADFAAGGRLVLRAPRAGFVNGPAFGTGDALTTGEVIAFVGAPQTPLISLDAPVTTARGLRVGDQIIVRSRGCEANATLHAVGRTVDPNSQTVPLHAEVSGATCLLPGEVVTATVTPQSAAVGGFAVPPSAFVRRGNSTYLFARSQQGFLPIAVDAAAARAGFARGVTLSSGTEVVVQGAALLKAEWQKHAAT